jgi:Flp pilus assembly protein TadD
MAHAELGKIYIRARKLDEAVSSFRAAMAIEPADFESHLNCGYALLNKRSLDEATREFDQAAALNQAAVSPHYYLGLVFLEKKDLDGAQKKFEFARDLTGANAFPQIHRYLGGIYWKKGTAETADKQRRELFKQAADELEKYVKLLPTANDAKRIQQTITELRTKMG